MQDSPPPRPWRTAGGLGATFMTGGTASSGRLSLDETAVWADLLVKCDVFGQKEER